MPLWKGLRYEDPVRLPPVPVPAQARREDPAVQYHPAPCRRSRRDRLLTRTLGRGGAGRRGDRALLRALRDGAGERAGAGGAYGGAGPHARALVDGVFLLPRARASGPQASCRRAFRSCVRSLLVGRAVRRGRRGRSEDTRLRRHGLPEVARVRALQTIPTLPWVSLRGPQA